MSKYKAIVSDFDGTLVDQTHELTPAVREAIKAYVDNGNIFSIATGRAYRGVVEKVCKELGLTGLIIVRGGSEIIDVQTNTVVWGKYMNPTIVLEMIETLSIEGVLFAAERGDFIYSTKGETDPEFGAQASFRDIREMPLDTVPKIVVSPVLELEKVEALLQNLTNRFPSLHIVKIKSWNGFGMDINDGAAGKHTALLQYAKLTNLDPREIIGVGDSYNDYPLLTACGLKVVMKNAPSELKQIADMEVATQEEDGILEVLSLITA